MICKDRDKLGYLRDLQVLAYEFHAGDEVVVAYDGQQRERVHAEEEVQQEASAPELLLCKGQH